MGTLVPPLSGACTHCPAAGRVQEPPPPPPPSLRLPRRARRAAGRAASRPRLHAGCGLTAPSLQLGPSGKQAAHLQQREPRLAGEVGGAGRGRGGAEKAGLAPARGCWEGRRQRCGWVAAHRPARQLSTQAPNAAPGEALQPHLPLAGTPGDRDLGLPVLNWPLAARQLFSGSSIVTLHCGPAG